MLHVAIRAVLVCTLALSAAPGVAQAATVLHYNFNETGNAPGSDGTNATPVKMRNDLDAVLDFHSVDGGGVTGLPGDRSFANTGSSAQGSLASGATNGFRADQPDIAAIDTLSAFTISGWFKTELADVNQIQGATPRLVTNHDAGAGSAGDGFNLQFLSDTEGDLKLDVDDDSTFADSSGTGAPYSGKQKWVFFAVSYDGTLTTNNVNFYIGFRNDTEAGGGPGSANVALVKTTTLNRGPVDTETAGLTIANRPGEDRPFKGFVDEIRIDDVAHAGGGGLAALESYRQAALVAPRDVELRRVSSANVSTAVLDQDAIAVTVPELSGITYDPTVDRFWAIGDNDGRLVQLDVDFDASGAITSATALSAVSLDDVQDFEGVAFTNPARNSVFVCEENNPGVHEYSLATGALLQDLSVPTVFTANARANRSFESLVRSPDATEMITGVEQALTVDGPAGTSTTVSTVARLLRYAVSGNVATAAEQYAYVVEPLHVAGAGDGSSLSEIIVLPNGEWLALERSITDAETLIRVFLASPEDATDVSQGALGAGLIGQSYTPVSKTLLFSDATIDKFEGMTVGPTLAGGDLALLGVEDAGGSTAVIRSFVLSGDFSGDPCAALGGDTDGDGACNDVDNCPTVANAGQEDGAGGLEVTIAGAFSPDGVGDACDNCVRVNNPRVAAGYLTTNPWRTLTGGQIDDDHDGYGNKCDGKFVGLPSQNVGGLDLGQFRTSNGEDRRFDTCGTAGGTRPCAIYDLDEAAVGNFIGGLDLGRLRQLSGTTPGPRCAACTGTGSVPLPCTAGTAGACN
jgi:hypothetical protein